MTLSDLRERAHRIAADGAADHEFAALNYVKALYLCLQDLAAEEAGHLIHACILEFWMRVGYAARSVRRLHP